MMSHFFVGKMDLHALPSFKEPVEKVYLTRHSACLTDFD